MVRLGDSGVLLKLFCSSYMDSGGIEVNNCHGTKSSVDSKREGVHKGEEEEDGETNSLLRPALNGGLVGKRQKSSKRKVQWNDRNGNKLVEVLEFQPRSNLSVPLQFILFFSFIFVFIDSLRNEKF